MIKYLGEIQVRFHTPRAGMVTFVASNPDGCVTLSWMHDLDGDGKETLGEWDGTSLILALENADEVYQAALTNGHRMAFDDGSSVQLPEAVLAAWDGLIQEIQARDE